MHDLFSYILRKHLSCTLMTTDNQLMPFRTLPLIVNKAFYCKQHLCHRVLCLLISEARLVTGISKEPHQWIDICQLCICRAASQMQSQPVSVKLLYQSMKIEARSRYLSRSSSCYQAQYASTNALHCPGCIRQSLERAGPFVNEYL